MTQPSKPVTELLPVAWRWRYVYEDKISGWKVRQTPVVPHDARPGYAALEVEALYTRPTRDVPVEGEVERPWQPWERNYSGNRIGVRIDGDWTILHVLSGGAETTTSIRDHEAWDLALRLSPQLKARLGELFDARRKAENALHSLTWRKCPTDTLRRIADEHDCGEDCPHATRMHCPLIEEGCARLDATEIRELADAIDLGNEVSRTSEGERIRVLEEALTEAFDFLGGVDDASEIRDKILAALSEGDG